MEAVTAVKFFCHSWQCSTVDALASGVQILGLTFGQGHVAVRQADRRPPLPSFGCGLQRTKKLEEIMRRNPQLTTTVALVAAVLASITTEAKAQQMASPKWGTTDIPAAQALLSEGDEHLGNSRYAAARAKYEEAAELIRTEAAFAGVALYRIAASFYYEGKPMTSTSRLDDLAEEAAEWGDVVTYAWALADAAWILGQQGKKIDMDARVESLNRLLKSPYIPKETREEITSKRLGEFTTLVQ